MLLNKINGDFLYMYFKDLGFFFCDMKQKNQD